MALASIKAKTWSVQLNLVEIAALSWLRGSASGRLPREVPHIPLFFSRIAPLHINTGESENAMKCLMSDNECNDN